MKSVNELLQLFMRQAQLERAMKQRGGARIVEEQELNARAAEACGVSRGDEARRGCARVADGPAATTDSIRVHLKLGHPAPGWGTSPNCSASWPGTTRSGEPAS